MTEAEVKALILKLRDYDVAGTLDFHWHHSQAIILRQLYAWAEPPKPKFHVGFPNTLEPRP